MGLLSRVDKLISELESAEKRSTKEPLLGKLPPVGIEKILEMLEKQRMEKFEYQPDVGPNFVMPDGEKFEYQPDVGPDFRNEEIKEWYEKLDPDFMRYNPPPKINWDDLTPEEREKLIKKLYKYNYNPPKINWDDLTPEEREKLIKKLYKYNYNPPKTNPEDIEKYLMNFAGGGIMDINRMTAPLGYAAGGPIPLEAPELSEGYDPILKGYDQALANINNPEYIHKWNMTRPRQPGLDEQLMQDYEPPIPRRGKAKEKLKRLGSKGLEGIRSLFGARAAEGSTLMDDAMTMKILGMKFELQKVLSLDMIDKMEEMGPIEIEDLYNKTFGN